MTIWIDAQLPPGIAVWINETMSLLAVPVRDLGLRDAEDEEIFLAAKRENAVLLTKDRDFVSLIDRFGAPPQIIWLTCGNTSNSKLKEILSSSLNEAIQLLEAGEKIVEISSV